MAEKKSLSTELREPLQGPKRVLREVIVKENRFDIKETFGNMLSHNSYLSARIHALGWCCGISNMRLF